jgi:hypothetical protein
VIPAENHLIELLSRTDRTRLLRLVEPVTLKLSEVLGEAQQPVRHLWFPVDGFISLVTLITGHPGLEVGMVGREGMLGAQVALDVTKSPLRALVQGAAAPGGSTSSRSAPSWPQPAAAAGAAALPVRAHGAAGWRRPACATT